MASGDPVQGLINVIGMPIAANVVLATLLAALAALATTRATLGQSQSNWQGPVGRHPPVGAARQP
ncbi:hypothetical protein MSIMFB_04369 [Mycobacterium simulans]|uniref:Uncharacterized protein n=1 Tax=Mycobacterium simulans TaxID=627089 RepID=A0A7Z7INJ6_9MYCO|nr:hypothetical protein MSIMFB_04369 [Mycobacterium simulans]